MKKLILFSIAALALFAGCQQDPMSFEQGGGIVITAGREAGPATRSAMNEDGENLWSVGDQILVAWAGQKPSVFKSKEKEATETAKFQGLLPVNNSGSDTKYGIYPAEDGNIVNSDGSYELKFHAEQNGVAGTYDPEAFLAVAQSSGNDLAFYNVLGLLKMQFADNGISQVTLRPGAPEEEVPEDPEPEDDPDDVVVTSVIRAGAPEEEAEGDDAGFIPGGVLTVKGQTPEVIEFSEELQEVVLYAPDGDSFETGVNYYLALPPCVLEKGVTFELKRGDGKTATVALSGSKEVERSKIHDVGVLSFSIPVESIELDPTELELYPEDSETISATVEPDNATDSSLVWTSSDESIATVEDGVVTAVAPGECTITATAADGSGVYAEVYVEVLPIMVSEFSVNPEAFEMMVGDDPVVITATVGPENATDPTVVWDSSAYEIATVEDGVVTAVGEGECTIYAYVNYETPDEIMKEIYVTVHPMVVVQEVQLYADFDYIYIGDSDYVELYLYPKEAPYASITWSTTDSCASVDPETGKITGISEGNATITVTVVNKDGSEVTGQCVVVIKDPYVRVESVWIDDSDYNPELTVGGSFDLYVQIYPDYPEPATNSSIKWSSSNEDVATVDNGTVTIVGFGECTITATSVDGPYDTFSFSVDPIRVEFVEILYPSYTDLHVGESITLAASVYPPEATYPTITWESSNTDVLTVDPDTGQITAVGKGNASITATADGESESITLYVNDLIDYIDYYLDFYDTGDTGYIEIQLSECPFTHTVTFESLDESVVTVDSDGWVKAVGYGSTKIVVKVDGVEVAKIDVSVYSPPAPDDGY